MIVALRALDLQTEKNLGRFGGRLQAVLLEFASQKVGGAVEPRLARLVDPSGRDQFVHELIVRHVPCQGPPQPLPHPTPIDPIVVTAATDQQGGPNVGPIAGVFLAELFPEKPVDKPSLLGGRRIGQKGLQFVHRGHAADNVQMDPSTPFTIRRARCGLQFDVGPTGRHLLIDERYCRNTEVFVGSQQGAPGRNPSHCCNDSKQPRQHATEPSGRQGASCPPPFIHRGPPAGARTG